MSIIKYIASVSFGKDSLAMLLKLLELGWPLDYVVFYDTGMEFQAIYNIRDKIVPVLENKGIKFVELRPDEPFLFTMFERKVKNRNKEGFHYGYSWCGGKCRWGTTAKNKAIKKFKESLNEPVIDYVGIAADEPERFEKQKSEGKVLPLVDWGMTEVDCLDFCRQRGYNWIEGNIDLYDILDRVSCWCCANKNLKELRAYYQFLPEYWNKLKELQSKTDRPFRGCYKGNPIGIFELEDRFKKELQQGEK